MSVNFGEYVRLKLRKALTEAFKDVQPELEKLAKESAGSGGGGGGGYNFGDVGSLVTLIEDVVLVVVGGAAPEIALPMAALREAETKAGKFGVAAGLGYLMWSVGYPAVQPLVLPLTHASAATFTNEIFDPNTAADLFARGIHGSFNVNAEIGGGGFDVPHAADLIEAAYTWPDKGELLELLRRGEIPLADVTKGLQRGGLHPDMVPHIETLAKNLLGPADIALANLRGYLTDQQSYDYVAQLGVDKADFDILLADTGEPPGVEELLFLYRRGKLPINLLERGIRQSRYRNEWIPHIEDLRYVPMSTEQAIKANIEHYLSDDDAKTIADQNGLEPAQYEPLRLSWGRPLGPGEMASLVHRGLASPEQFDQAIRESNIKDKYLGMAFDAHERLPSERLIVDAIKFGAATMQEGAKLLMQLGYTPDSVSLLLKLGLHESSSVAHTLTQSQITTLYKDGVLGRHEAKDHLTALGYSVQDSEYLLQVIDIQGHVAEVRAETSAIRLSYLAGGITAQQAEHQLQQIGVSQPQAQHNITVWNREKHRAERTLSEAQIVKAAGKGVMTFDTALNLLKALGYSGHDANTLLHTAGVVLPPEGQSSGGGSGIDTSEGQTGGLT